MAPSNALPIHGNEKTMNLNSLVLANIQASPYFKHHLYELKTYHQVIDEIYYKVNHLEPWEKGSRKTAGQTGMCGGVRGVGTGGIVSSAYCLLYKLYTLKLTRKQVIGLCSHTDSPFIRALGLMYIRYTQPPNTFWEWFETYLDDEEEVDPKAGGGNNMTIGEMAEQLLAKLEWYGTLFPRIPVPIQKDIETRLRQHKEQRGNMARQARLTQGGPEGDVPPVSNNQGNNEVYFGEAERMSRIADRESAQMSAPSLRSPVREREASLPAPHRRRSYSRSRSRGRRSKSREGRKRSRDRRERSRDKKKESRRRSKSRSTERRDHHKKKSSRHRSRSRSDERKDKKHHKRSRRSTSRSRRSRDEERHRSHEDDFQRDLKREMERVKKSKNGVENEHNCDK